MKYLADGNASLTLIAYTFDVARQTYLKVLSTSAAYGLLLPLVGLFVLASIHRIFALAIAVMGPFAILTAEVFGFVPSFVTSLIFVILKDKKHPIIVLLVTEFVAALSCVAWWTLFPDGQSGYGSAEFLQLMAVIAATATLALTVPNCFRKHGTPDKTAQAKDQCFNSTHSH